jgi:hypothetical protein
VDMLVPMTQSVPVFTTVIGATFCVLAAAIILVPHQGLGDRGENARHYVGVSADCKRAEGQDKQTKVHDCLLIVTIVVTLLAVRDDPIVAGGSLLRLSNQPIVSAKTWAKVLLESRSRSCFSSKP